MSKIEILDEIRRSLGLTKVGFSKALSVNERTVRRWYKGDTEPHDSYIKRAKTLEKVKY